MAAHNRTRGTVRIGGTPNDDMTPVVYAQRTGMFERAGLDVVVEKGLNGSAVAAAVASGSYDIGKSVISALLDAHEKGIPFRIIAPSSIEDVDRPYGGMIYLHDVTVKSGKDLEGQTIALGSLGSIGRVAVPAWMDQHGGDGTTVKFVESPVLGRARRGRAAPCLCRRNHLPEPRRGDGDRQVRLRPGVRCDRRPLHRRRLLHDGELFGRPSRCRPQTFVRTYYDAARYTNAHPDATASMMADFTGVPVDASATMRRVQSAVELDLGQIQPTIALYAKYGLLRRRSRPAISSTNALVR